MTRLRLIFVLAPLALAACGDKSNGNDARSASGEVLEGTISDAMLPVDTVRSEPPLAKNQAGSGSGSGGATSEAEDGATDAAADEGEAPAAEPAPQPSAT